MTLTRTCRIFEYRVPRGHFPHAEVLKYITCNSETSKQEIIRQFHYRELLIFKIAYLGEILKADWNVLRAHNKLFYCIRDFIPLFNAKFIFTKLYNIHLYYHSIESIFKPPLGHTNIAFPAAVTVLLEFVSVTSQDSLRRLKGLETSFSWFTSKYKLLRAVEFFATANGRFICQ